MGIQTCAGRRPPSRKHRTPSADSFTSSATGNPSLFLRSLRSLGPIWLNPWQGGPPNTKSTSPSTSSRLVGTPGCASTRKRTDPIFAKLSIEAAYRRAFPGFLTVCSSSLAASAKLIPVSGARCVCSPFCGWPIAESRAQHLAANTPRTWRRILALMQQKPVSISTRTSSHSGPLEVELTRRNIPFVKFGGLKFLDAAHVKDVLALLRFAENPRDRVAGFRVMHLLPGIGPASAQRILDHMAEAADPLGALCTLPCPPRAGDGWANFVETIGNLRYSEWPSDLERARLWYEPHLERIHEDAEVRRADLIQLDQIAGGYASRERFLTELTLDPPDATSDQAGVPLLDEDYLILSTIHSAKGQEWKSVYVLNVVDGCMPSDLGAGTSAELEEERRLLYVAMTRAKDDLHLVVPQRFFTHGQHSQGDRHVYASRTRFIPEKLLGLFDRTNWPTASTDAATRGPSQGPRVDLGARVRGMWR
jgi:UvrD-like helicase C-terminal domain